MCLIPHFISGAMGAYLFYAQHNFPGSTFVGNEDWTYEGAALDSSSYMKLSVPLQWATANIGFHHIHHLNARIPFYRLPEVMNSLPELQSAKTTTLKPKDIMACFKLKVYDFETQQLVGI
jgi:omega-6 fatty acid desaturase (delta-12 desaturase)